MPWREICPMDEKMRLVAAVLADEHSMSELCASLGVSRKTGYKWLLRYRAQGAAGLHELSRASGAVGDRGGPSTSDSGAALCASELGTQEVARQARATQAAGELARAEHDRRVAAPPGVNSAAQAAPSCASHCDSAEGSGGCQ